MDGKIPDGFRLGPLTCLPFETKADASPDAIYTSSGYFFVLKSAHPEVGVDFMRFMTSREMAGTFAQMRDVLVAVDGLWKVV